MSVEALKREPLTRARRAPAFAVFTLQHNNASTQKQ